MSSTSLGGGKVCVPSTCRRRAGAPPVGVTVHSARAKHLLGIKHPLSGCLRWGEPRRPKKNHQKEPGPQKRTGG